MEDINIEFSEEEYNKIIQAAAICGMSIDEFVEKALTDYLERTDDL